MPFRGVVEEEASITNSLQFLSILIFIPLHILHFVTNLIPIEIVVLTRRLKFVLKLTTYQTHP